MQVLERFRGQGQTMELTEAQERLMGKFREGMAEALGVSPEAIKEEPLRRWIEEFARAWVKPEYLSELVSPAAEKLRDFGYRLGQIIAQVREGKVRKRITQAFETETNNEERQKKVYTSDISVG